MTDQIKCDAVQYRQGFVQVTNIHGGLVNLEVWNVHPDKSIATAALVASASISDADIVANTEIELSVAQAKELVRQLELAIRNIEDGAINAAQQSQEAVPGHPPADPGHPRPIQTSRRHLGHPETSRTSIICGEKNRPAV